MSKQKYIALLTEGELEPEIHEVLIQCGYKLKRASEYSGHITNHYAKENIPATGDKCKDCKHVYRTWLQVPCSNCCHTKVLKVSKHTCNNNFESRDNA